MSNPDTITSNAGTGFANGLLGLVGLGQFCDPLSDLKGDLSEAKNNLSTVVSIGTTAALNEQVKIDSDMINYINKNNEIIYKTQEYYNILSTNNTQEQNYFLSITTLLVFIIIFFILIKN